jgi:SAM-dependent methyltransferase
MLAFTQPHEGVHALDVGTGSGDLAITLGARVGASGSVIGVDFSASMIEAGERATKAAGLSNVRMTAGDAEALPFPPESFDIALARNVLMFVGDLDRALSSIRRILRKGGRFAACTWAGLEENPFNAIVLDALRARGKMPEGPFELMRAFSVSDPIALERALRRTGFDGIAVERIASRRTYANLEAAMTVIRETPLYAEPFQRTTERERTEIWADIAQGYAAFQRPDASLDFPIVSLVALAVAS